MNKNLLLIPLILCAGCAQLMRHEVERTADKSFHRNWLQKEPRIQQIATEVHSNAWENEIKDKVRADILAALKSWSNTFFDRLWKILQGLGVIGGAGGAGAIGHKLGQRKNGNGKVDHAEG